MSRSHFLVGLKASRAIYQSQIKRSRNLSSMHLSQLLRWGSSASPLPLLRKICHYRLQLRWSPNRYSTKPRVSRWRLLFLISRVKRLLAVFLTLKKISSRFCRSQPKALVLFSTVNLQKGQARFSQNHRRAKARCLGSQQRQSRRSSTNLRMKLRDLYSASRKKEVFSKPSQPKNRKWLRKLEINQLKLKRADCLWLQQ